MVANTDRIIPIGWGFECVERIRAVAVIVPPMYPPRLLRLRPHHPAASEEAAGVQFNIESLVFLGADHKPISIAFVWSDPLKALETLHEPVEY